MNRFVQEGKEDKLYGELKTHTETFLTPKIKEYLQKEDDYLIDDMNREFETYFEKFHVITDYLIPIRRWVSNKGLKHVHDLQVQIFKDHVFMNKPLCDKFIRILLD